MPWADVLYACDASWWDISGPINFDGEKWSSHGDAKQNEKRPAAKKHGLNLISGDSGEGFCLEPGLIHYGDNSGFQAVNLALQFGAKLVRLVGFDMQVVGNKRHFFGDHPDGLSNGANYAHFVGNFERAAALLPDDIRIINCTPGSALTCFKTGLL